ncbi:MAG: ABC transporter ATP-binding protein [Solirubrobacteraceae bacterium]
MSSRTAGESSAAADDPVQRERTGALERAGRSDQAIVVEHVSHRYGDQESGLAALDDISLRAEPESVLAVVGPSGCGKTTLLELICGLHAAQTGVICCPPAALMPQRDLLLPWLSALDNAALPLRIEGQSRQRARATALPLFAELGLDGFDQARPHELSGGMRQRVAFLRTLLAGRPVLCLDEPFGALDAITRMQMQGWLAEALEREPRTVLLVTHDVEEAALLADRVVVMGARPGTVLESIDVEGRRPRARTDAVVLALRERALSALGLGAER